MKYLEVWKIVSIFETNKSTFSAEHWKKVTSAFEYQPLLT